MIIFLQISSQETSNMDNQTKILLDRIYEKMKTVDESIDEKSQRLLYAILTRFYKEDCKVIDQDSDWVLITKGKGKSKELKDRILDIELHRLGATEETWKLACKMLDHDHVHTHT